MDNMYSTLVRLLESENFEFEDHPDLQLIIDEPFLSKESVESGPRQYSESTIRLGWFSSNYYADNSCSDENLVESRGILTHLCYNLFHWNRTLGQSEVIGSMKVICTPYAVRKSLYSAASCRDADLISTTQRELHFCQVESDHNFYYYGQGTANKLKCVPISSRTQVTLPLPEGPSFVTFG